MTEPISAPTAPTPLAAARACAVAALLPLLAAQDPGQQTPLQPMLLPQGVVLPRGDVEIVVDGSLVDWPRLPAMRLDDRRQLSGTALGAWRGPKDCSALVFMIWDKQMLYIACSAQDEMHRALDANTLRLTEIPAADSLLLSFDPDRNTRSNGSDPGRREDREFWLADDSGREVVQWDRLRGQANVLSAPARMVVLHQKEEGVTTYEAAIPWDQILPPGRSPAIGDVIDLQMVLNDFDEITDSMAQTRAGWTFGLGPVVDPGLYGSIMLVGDDAAMRGAVPEFPPKPGVPRDPVPPEEFWRELTAKLLKNPPAAYDGSVPAAEVGGIERLEALEEIDEQVQRFPRVDFLELHHRIHRRMKREVAGLSARGLPWWWRDRLFAVSKQGEDPVPEGAVRLFKLPMGGWLVRTAKDNLVVDPAGSDVREWLWGGAQHCVLTRPLDMTRRNDQLLMAMFASEPRRTVLSHIVFHLPVVSMADMPVVRPGETYAGGTLTVEPLGETDEQGRVSYDCSYRIVVEGAPPILLVTPSLKPEQVPEGKVGVVIATARNPRLPEIVGRVDPEMVLFDEAFRCSWHAQTPRVTLRNLHAIQRALLPHRSVVLAPGESWQVGG